jgi:hypothetical protein
MHTADILVAGIEQRRAFHAWSVALPGSFSETFIEADNYWHAWDEHRSVSMTSVVVKEKRRAVTARELIDTMSVVVTGDGDPVEGVPEGLIGCASFGPTPQPARASSALTGLLATDGRALLVTITSDNFDWARSTWLSIRSHPAELNVALATRHRTGGAHTTTPKRQRRRR